MCCELLTIWLPVVVPAVIIEVVAVVAADEPMDPTLFFFWKLSMTELMSCKFESSASCRKPDICGTGKKTYY